VLIQHKAKGLLPEWMRFVKGVVDSEDVPLNLSREHLQDTALIRRLNAVLTKRILKFLAEEAQRDVEKYNNFFSEFGNFIKEGICTDFQYKEQLGKLLRCESSGCEPGKLVSLDEYISRMKPEQNEIFFLCVPSRSFAEISPYYEGFKKKSLEVLFFFTNLDDFVLSNLGEYDGKKLVSIEAANVDSKDDDAKKDTSTTDEELKELTDWLKDILSDKVHTIRTTTRLVSSPAIIVDHESASFRRMLRFVDPERSPKLPKQILEINPKHPIMIHLNSVRSSNPDLAKNIAEQLFDNALIAAGLLDDARTIVGRMNSIMETVLLHEAKTPAPASLKESQNSTKVEKEKTKDENETTKDEEMTEDEKETTEDEKETTKAEKGTIKAEKETTKAEKGTIKAEKGTTKAEKETTKAEKETTKAEKQKKKTTKND